MDTYVARVKGVEPNVVKAYRTRDAFATNSEQTVLTTVPGEWHLFHITAGDGPATSIRLMTDAEFEASYVLLGKPAVDPRASSGPVATLPSGAAVYRSGDNKTHYESVCLPFRSVTIPVHYGTRIR